MAENVKKQLPSIQKSYGREVEINIIRDRSEVLMQSLRELGASLLLGAVIAFAVLLVFLRNIRRSLILLVSLPASLLWAVLFLNLAGKSLNLMSLGGLAIGVGMVVDNGIVMTERLGRLSLGTRNHKEKCRMISSAASDLSSSLAGSTATTLIVFLPLLLMPGISGSLFSDLALGVIFALSSSLIISLTVIPVLYLKLAPKDLSRREYRFLSKLRKILRGSIRRPASAVLLTAVSIAAAVLILPVLEREVIPPLNDGSLSLCITMPPGTNMEEIKYTAADSIKALSTISFIEKIHIRSGGESDDPYYLSSTDESAETIQLRIIYRKGVSRTSAAEAVTNRLRLNKGKIRILPAENIIEKYART